MIEPLRSVPRRSPALLLLLLAAFAAVSVWLAATLNLWRDEGYTQWTVAGDLETTLDRAVGFSQLLPVYFVTLHFWSLPWESPTLDRLLSVLFAGGAIAASWALSRRVLPRLHPIVLPLLVATHPLTLFAATEMRPYGLILLLSTLLLLGHQAAYWSEAASGRWRAAFVVLATVSLYTQHYLGYLLACLGAGLVAAGRWRAAVRYALDMLLTAALCLPMWLWLPAQVGDRLKDLDPAPPLLQQVRLAAERIESYAFPLTTAAVEGGLSLEELRVALRAHRAAVLAAIVALLASLRGQWRLLLSERHRAWTAIVLGYVPFFVLSIAAVGVTGVAPRHTIGILVPVLVTTLLWFETAPRRGPLVAVVALMLAGNVATATIRFAPLAKECDCKRVAAWIEAREAPGEPILVFIAEDLMPMQESYHGPNALVPIPRHPLEGLDHWDPRLLILRSPAEVAQALERAAPGADVIFVYKSATQRHLGFSYGGDHLEEFLANGWRETAREEFYRGTLVRRFERIPPRLPWGR